MKSMIIIPTILSLTRVPLALLLFAESPIVRFMVIVGAMATDFFDGFLARRFHSVSKMGTLIDPLTDKLFVGTALLIFLLEDRLVLPQILAFLGRDLALLFFGVFHCFSGTLTKIRIQSIWSGKIATTLQFIALLFLSIGLRCPEVLFTGMMFCGVAALIELLILQRKYQSL